MFEDVSERVSDWLLENETIPMEDKEIYRYGIQQGMIALLNLGTTVVIGMVFGKLLESILFMTAYIPLRSYAGGYHAKTAVRCYFFSIVMMSAVLWVMRYLSYSGFICGCLTAIFGTVIWFLVPVENGNKPLDDVEKMVYRNKARIVLLFEVVFLFISLLLKWKRSAICMTMVFCVIVIMLLLGRWKNDYTRKRTRVERK